MSTLRLTLSAALLALASLTVGCGDDSESDGNDGTTVDAPIAVDATIDMMLRRSSSICHEVGA